MPGGPHLFAEAVSKLPVAVHVVAQPTKLLPVGGHLCGYGINGGHGPVAVCLHLCHDVERQLPCVGLVPPLPLHKLDEFFALRPATLVETGIDGVFVGIHQLAHPHAQQERLAVTLGDAETA